MTQALQDQVADLLGREPRGLRAVSVVDEQQRPVVIRVAPLVDKKPFPTLFWLVDKDLNYRIDQVEARGLIHTLQQRIDNDKALQKQMRVDHCAYIALREQYMSEAEKRQLAALGFLALFNKRGIGGIENFTRIRCLHTWYGAHLVVPNTVGRLLDEHWRQNFHA
ncbi:MAG: hypothetical protein CR978_00540 [Gammaproteobacteria bacterium]|nr:MAG: hypothetical protein CR978_00540 [Gammaproteobacteria bacterium]